MAPRTKPKCADCEQENSVLWHNPKNPICHNCYVKGLEKSTNNQEHSEDKKIIRRSARNGLKAKTKALLPAKSSKKTKHRKPIPKKKYELPPMVSDKQKVVTKILHKSIFYAVGDIVSIVDATNAVFYAQIRGLIINGFCDKIAFITWLIPTNESPSPRCGFDPSTYLLGFEDDEPRPLSTMSFVMSCPSDYFAIDMSKYPSEVEATPRSFWRRVNYEDYKDVRRDSGNCMESEDEPQQNEAPVTKFSNDEL